MPRQVIFIMVDTQGANCVGVYGDKALQTPRLDALAAQGVRFDQAHTTCPVCTPARAALFTGSFPHSNGAMGNEIPLAWNAKTLGQRLGDAGVLAGYTGKWHLSGLDYFDTGICPPGWDPAIWFDGRNHLDSLPTHLRRFSREYQTTESYRKAGFGVEQTFAFGVSERAREFIAKHREEDFCLVVSYDEPHHPSMAPPPFTDLHQDYVLDTGAAREDDLVGKPALQHRWADRVRGHDTRTSDGRYHCPLYFASNTFVDHEIGRVLDTIDEHVPGALVLYTSDHGEMMHAHQLHSKGPAMYEQITRVPFIVRWPGVVRPGQVCRQPLSHIDVTPTVLDYFGLELPPVLEGKSMLPAFRDPASITRETIFMEFTRFSGSCDDPGFTPIRCAFDGRFKLAINLLDRDELYDLHEDPAENYNRIDDPALADERARLHRAIIDQMYNTHDLFRGEQWERRPWDRGDLVVPHANRRTYRPDGYLPLARSYMTGAADDEES